MSNIPESTTEQPLDLVSFVEQNEQAVEVSEQNWFRRNAFKLSTGVFLGGTAVTVATNPLEETGKELVEAAPVFVGGLALSEGMFLAGAAVMAASAGKKIGNPLKLRGRWEEIGKEVSASKAFRTGLNINTAGALGTAAVVGGGAVAELPIETWPGALGIAAADMVATVGVRAGLYSGIKQAKAVEAENKEVEHDISVRLAKEEDIERLAEIDILLFKRAYGEEAPDKSEVVDMLRKRFLNAPGWMYVAELDGVIEGFVTAFRTNKPSDEFISWEDSTANGTLEGKVDPKGEYVYVANMTITHEAVVEGAEEMLLANLFANSIRDGVKHGYFASRMPDFKPWLEEEMRNNKNMQFPSNQTEFDDLANRYADMRREKDGKRQDKQLRMYEGMGYELKRVVANSNEDDASYNYGVLCEAGIPPYKNSLRKIKPLRLAIAGLLRLAAKNPKLIKKVI